MENEVIVKFIPAKHWWNSSKWELVEECISLNEEVTVPIGFITDGASIPLFARTIFSPTGRYFSAAIIHDYIIVNEQNWKKANHQFEAELNRLGIVAWRKDLMLVGVKMWAWFLKLIGKNSIDD